MSASASRIYILDFGSQYTQVIARRVRELRVYSEIIPYHTPASVLGSLRPAGLILSGGPASVYSAQAPLPDPAIFKLGVPVLGICYGMQLMGHFLGGKVEAGDRREFGQGLLRVLSSSPLFAELPREFSVWNSHGDKLTQLPEGFRVAASTENAPWAAIEDPQRQLYGLQFHPEVAHTSHGLSLLSNFVRGICRAEPTWTMQSFIDSTCVQLRQQVGTERVILGLSGGVDSSVTAALLHRAIGAQLHCIFVDNGLLRQGEREAVRSLCEERLGLPLHVADAAQPFLRQLRGVTDPERKRKIIGREFVAAFERVAKTLGKVRYLAQGTLYPDIIESVPIAGNPASVIKSHHNVGGLPKRLKFELVEPLRQLFKDEVRKVGAELGLTKDVIARQPFPGPGLAVRCLGEITPEKLSLLRAADAIVIEEMKRSDWYYQVWQSFAVLLPVRSVGVMGDERTYDYTIALRVVESQDGMTADWVRLPYDLLAVISRRITNEVKGISRVVLDISSKPPATIEWE